MITVLRVLPLLEKIDFFQNIIINFPSNRIAVICIRNCKNVIFLVIDVEN